MQRRCLTWACRRGITLFLLIGSYLHGQSTGSGDDGPEKPLGFVRTSLPQGYRLVCNPLINNPWPPVGLDRANSLANLIPVGMAQEGMLFIKYNGRRRLTNEWHDGAWSDPAMTFFPGEAAVVFSPVDTNLTWVGAVVGGDINIFIPAGLSLHASMIPQEGPLTTVLKFPLVPGTKIFGMNTQGGFVLRATATTNGWRPKEPVIQVADGIAIDAPQDFVWSRRWIADDGLDQPPTSVPSIRSRQIRLGGSFTLQASGSVPAGTRYQWQRNGYDIPQATNAELSVTKAHVSDLGSYWALVYPWSSWIASPITRVELFPSEIPRLNVSTAPGGAAVIIEAQLADRHPVQWESSTDLTHWTDLPPGDRPTAFIEVPDVHNAVDAARFYRARME